MLKKLLWVLEIILILGIESITTFTGFFCIVAAITILFVLLVNLEVA